LLLLAVSVKIAKFKFIIPTSLLKSLWKSRLWHRREPFVPTLHSWLN